MSLNYILSDELESVLEKISVKNKPLAIAVVKKIEQIAALDETTVQHFKNLRGNMKEYKRVHVGSFVLLFKVHGDIIVFDKLLHHDDAYK
jgi:mRNA-degrading endonuclease RelE of RelBE toxin-antitoxin system